MYVLLFGLTMLTVVYWIIFMLSFLFNILVEFLSRRFLLDYAFALNGKNELSDDIWQEQGKEIYTR